MGRMQKSIYKDANCNNVENGEIFNNMKPIQASMEYRIQKGILLSFEKWSIALYS